MEMEVRVDPNDAVEEKVFVYISDFTPEGVRPKDEIDIDLFRAADYDPSEARRRAPGTLFRWIHIPVNDTTFVTDCVKTLIGTDRGNSLPNTWLHKLRPTSSIPGDIVPNHARSMEPSFQLHAMDEGGGSGRPPPFTLYLPYLNWEVFQNLGNQNLIGTDHTANSTRHPRKTLDQFFYSGLRDTASRDAGQTVSKWTGANPGSNGRENAAEDSYVVMVDQLWIWVLDDETLVSSFPSHRFQFKGIPGGPQVTDVLTSATADPRKCQDLFDLTALLVMHSVTNIFAEENGKFVDALAIYRWAIAINAARHTEKLEAFSKRQSSHNAEEIAVEGTEELKLALEVADILDELNMLLHLLEKQADVLASTQGQLQRFKPLVRSHGPEEGQRIEILRSSLGDVHISNSGNIRGRLLFDEVSMAHLYVDNQDGTAPGELALGGNAGILVQEAAQRLSVEKANLERLRVDAARTHQMLIELLDLEQKAASLEEARATTKQGQAVMLFTIVTIVFLPLSFFTSYFGQNVSDITGDDKNPTSGELWRVAGPISVVVIFSALLVAYFIVYPRKISRHGMDMA